MLTKSKINGVLRKLIFIYILVVLMYNTINYFDVRYSFMNLYKINLGNTISYAKNIGNELEISGFVSPKLLLGLNQSVTTQFSLVKTFNTNYKERLAFPIADIMCYSDAINIITYKILSNNQTDEDYKILKIISSDFTSLGSLILSDNYITFKEYQNIRGNLKLFTDIDITEYIIKHNYIFEIKS